MLRLQRRRFFPEIVVLNHLRYSVPRGDGQAEWAWVVDQPTKVNNTRTNRARRSLTSLM